MKGKNDDERFRPDERRTEVGTRRARSSADFLLARRVIASSAEIKRSERPEYFLPEKLGPHDVSSFTLKVEENRGEKGDGFRPCSLDRSAQRELKKSTHVREPKLFVRKTWISGYTGKPEERLLDFPSIKPRRVRPAPIFVLESCPSLPSYVELHL